MKTMTKNEFKKRRESDDTGGGITFDDVAECAKAWAKAWGVYSTPRIHPMATVRYEVLKAAGTSDAEEFAPKED